jgi:hypothetical protein
MLSIKTVSASASAERLAEQVKEDHQKFCQEQDEFAVKALRQNGLYLTRGDSEEPCTDGIYIKTVDMGGGFFRLQLKLEDEVRDPSGLCLGCKLPISSTKKSDCYLGCRNTATRISPQANQSVPLSRLADGKTWTLTKTSRGIFLALIDPDSPPEKLKAPSPKVRGILKH